MRHVLALLVALAAATPLAAVADQFGCPHCRSCGRACVLKVEQVESEEECYEVECEEVCIPAVTLPWESCRTPKYGRSRLVARLKTTSRPTKVCKYEWVPVCPRCGRIEKNGGGSKDATVPPTPVPVTQPMPPAAPPAAVSVPDARLRFRSPERTAKLRARDHAFRLVGAESGRSSTR